MVVSRRSHGAEIKRLAAVAREAIERERAHRTDLSQRGRRLARSGATVGMIAVTGLVILALVRPRRDREDADANTERPSETIRRARNRKGHRKDNRILELARLAVTTSRFWESALARR
jgi:hypothetical protein